MSKKGGDGPRKNKVGSVPTHRIAVVAGDGIGKEVIP